MFGFLKKLFLKLYRLAKAIPFIGIPYAVAVSAMSACAFLVAETANLLQTHIIKKSGIKTSRVDDPTLHKIAGFFGKLTFGIYGHVFEDYLIATNKVHDGAGQKLESAGKSTWNAPTKYLNPKGVYVDPALPADLKIKQLMKDFDYRVRGAQAPSPRNLQEARDILNQAQNAGEAPNHSTEQNQNLNEVSRGLDESFTNLNNMVSDLENARPENNTSQAGIDQNLNEIGQGVSDILNAQMNTQRPNPLPTNPTGSGLNGSNNKASLDQGPTVGS